MDFSAGTTVLAGDATLVAREYCRLLASRSGLDETPS